MVSAANSFGLMDGGVDLAITRFFGVPLMDVQALSQGLGEQRSDIVHYRTVIRSPFVALLRRCACNGDFTRQCVRGDVGDLLPSSTQHVVVTRSEEWHAGLGTQRVVSPKLLGKWRSLITGICIL